MIGSGIDTLLAEVRGNMLGGLLQRYIDDAGKPSKLSELFGEQSQPFLGTHWRDVER